MKPRPGSFRFAHPDERHELEQIERAGGQAHGAAEQWPLPDCDQILTCARIGLSDTEAAIHSTFARISFLLKTAVDAISWPLSALLECTNNCSAIHRMGEIPNSCKYLWIQADRELAGVQLLL
jgi:hypothetical protein